MRSSKPKVLTRAIDPDSPSSYLNKSGQVVTDAWRAFSRRRLVQAMGVSGSLAAQGAVFGAGLSAWGRKAPAQTAPTAPEHYFIFVELAGGFYWPMALDARDPAALLAGPSANVAAFDIRKPWTYDQYLALAGNSAFTYQNGGGCIVPFDSSLGQQHWQDAITTGKTTLGLPYALGFCGAALKPVIDQMAVVRGVKMAGNFHGSNNSSDDMWSGTDKGGEPHVASVLAALLETGRDVKPLDNLVLENAFFPEKEATGAKPAIRTDGRTLGQLLNAFALANTLSGVSASERFRRMSNVATAILTEARPRLGKLQTGVYADYLGKFAPALTVEGKLLALGAKLGDGSDEFSLDLARQFDMAFTLLEAGLSRVITLCLGAPNATNNADVNGVFDAHYGLYTSPPTDANATHNNWIQITKAVEAIAAFVSRLSSLPADHPLKDKITVCITSEFTRQCNVQGAERVDEVDANGHVHFGGGHNFQNNNYVLFGKNVQGGAWLGKAGAGSMVRYDVDFAKLNSTAPEHLMDPSSNVFVPPASEASVVNHSSEPPPTSGHLRGFASRDMVQTALALAGEGAQYPHFYSRSDCADAQVIKPVLKPGTSS